MSKKLVTKDAELVSKVENVLKEKGVPCARVQLYKKEHGDAVASDELLLAVTNRNGAAMRDAIEACKGPDSKYYFGVLRNHPEYIVPHSIMKEISKQLNYENVRSNWLQEEILAGKKNRADNYNSAHFTCICRMLCYHLGLLCRITNQLHMRKQDFIEKHPGTAFLIYVLLCALLIVAMTLYVRYGFPIAFIKH